MMAEFKSCTAFLFYVFLVAIIEVTGLLDVSTTTRVKSHFLINEQTQLDLLEQAQKNKTS